MSDFPKVYPEILPSAPFSSEEELFQRQKERSKSAPSLNRPKTRKIKKDREGLPYSSPVNSTKSLPHAESKVDEERLYPRINLTAEKMRVDEERKTSAQPKSPLSANKPMKPNPNQNIYENPSPPHQPPNVVVNRNLQANRAPQQRPPQQRAPQKKPGGAPAGPPKGPDHRAFKLTDFEMPWTIMKVGFRYHTTLGQLEKVFFYLFRFGMTIIWGMSIYGSATGDSGGDGAFSPEDHKMWECDTHKMVCTVVCFNRFQPVMPARFLLVSMLITVAPDILFMLTFAKTDAHQKRVLVAKQSGKQHVALHEWEKKVGKYKEGVTETNVYLGKAGSLLWSSQTSKGRVYCQLVKFILDFFFFVSFNWVLQAQYNQHLSIARYNYSDPLKFYDAGAIISPEHYDCQAGSEYKSGCSNAGGEQHIPCYNSRNGEKSFFNICIVTLHFMSLIMLGIDVINLIRAQINKRKTKTEQELIELKQN